MVSLLSAPHRGGDGTFQGIASRYLQTVHAGDVIQARVLAAGDSFRLPLDPSVPVVLVSAGTGVAPFRGVVLDRLHTGERGPLLSYFGCDHPGMLHDLHRAEMEAAQEAGAVSMRPAFSQAPAGGVTFVQDRIAAEGEEVWELLSRDGRVYVCGQRSWRRASRACSSVRESSTTTTRSARPGRRAARRLRREGERTGTWLTVSILTFVGGGVFTAGGAALVLLAPSADKTADKRADKTAVGSRAFGCAPWRTGVACGGTFSTGRTSTRRIRPVAIAREALFPTRDDRSAPSCVARRLRGHSLRHHGDLHRL